MRSRFVKRSHTQTPSVILDTGKCKACWDCLGLCPQKVIGRVNLPWHKHALFLAPEQCSGCLKCARACRFKAITVTRYA